MGAWDVETCAPVFSNGLATLIPSRATLFVSNDLDAVVTQVVCELHSRLRYGIANVAYPPILTAKACPHTVFPALCIVDHKNSRDRTRRMKQQKSPPLVTEGL